VEEINRGMPAGDGGSTEKDWDLGREESSVFDSDDENADGTQISSKAAFPKKAGKRDIADINKKWKQTVLQPLDINAASVPIKNTFTTSFASSPLKNKTVDIEAVLKRIKEEGDKNPISRFLKMQLNSLVPVDEVEDGRKVRVVITIPESSNPGSPTSSRRLSMEDL
jgi:hypothetical protein